MGWLQIIMLVLSGLLKLLELFKKQDLSKLRPRQREKYGQLRTACRSFDEEAGARGLESVPIPKSMLRDAKKAAEELGD